MLDELYVDECHSLEQAHYIDVRTPDERKTVSIPGSQFIPMDEWRDISTEKLNTLLTDDSTPIIFYCHKGMRSLWVLEQFNKVSDRKAYSMVGGIEAWEIKGFETTSGIELNDSDRQRYAKHLNLEHVGEAGQKKLLDAKVLIVGAGGLGSPAAYYLTAAGVGQIGLLDPDKVEISNLQRQILHRNEQAGELKVETAKKNLKELNPNVHFQIAPQRLSQENADQIIPHFDLILDGSDNFETKYLINDLALEHNVPWVFGSVSNFEGQLCLFTPEMNACYRCLFPEAPSTTQNCSERGVLGALPGLVGTWQATETLKFLLGLVKKKTPELIKLDLLENRTQTIAVTPDSDCRCQK